MKIFLPYPPSQNRYLRHTSRGTYRTKEANAYRDTVRKVALLAGVEALKGSVEVVLTLHPRMTKKRVSSLVRLDVGNVEKVACDALNGVCYSDDGQIVRLVVEIGRAMPGGGLTVEVNAVIVAYI